MNNITQDLMFKQSVVEYSLKYGVTRASIQYEVHRKTIYRWREKYDGSINSLRNKSRRPRSHPNQHTQEEIEKIKRYKSHNKEDGLVVLWVKLWKNGYTRSITSLYRVMCKLGIYSKTPSKKKQYVPKPYEKMQYPGQRVQIDVKYVPRNCLLKEAIEAGEAYYQYTAIDEYSRKRVLWASKEHSTFASAQFVEIVIKKFKFKIECIQTDNGFEFTNRLNRFMSWKQTMFEKVLEEKGIKHKLIKPKTSRHNGKVERSHRKDQEYFYDRNRFESFEDLVAKGQKWIEKSNNFPTRPLGWKTPKEVLKRCLGVSRLRSYI